MEYGRLGEFIVAHLILGVNHSSKRALLARFAFPGLQYSILLLTLLCTGCGPAGGGARAISRSGGPWPTCGAGAIGPFHQADNTNIC